ncbi:D-alanine--D-alanyl carrier protein ligase [Seminavis robusta]|uniref:D-alanine--D-alanyl carrier protein ligase n=1 Tax=Seminavis robusta TaxID=568900 RepID=A0A9N8HW02_9STRA|nr:D-alanine--D-alanyl carrier protein ligase [Seminavis robusta]|eukprot:Sro1576_g283530.1 D-alanine--D-alanyl carrier protein ligase (1766) ;mRNA; f:6012-11561
MKFSSTILEALNHHAVETPNKVGFTWVDINCVEQNKMTFKQLHDQSNAIAAHLLKLGCKKGDRVMIAYPFGLEFLAAMFGAMKIGVIPCSIYPPNPNQLKTEMPKFRGFAEDAGAKYALSTTAFATAMTAVGVLYKTGVTWIGTDKLPIKKSNPKKPKDYEKYVGEPTDIGFIQYTSGSTGRPKGVMISHQNLAENCAALVKMTNATPSSVAALWVPQYHDMIEHYQATHTCAPNFAYALLLKRLEQANRTANWSCVKRAMFGGEPAKSHVVEAVAKTLSIKPAHVYNIYGLAESVVFLTGGSAYPDSEGLVCCGEVDSPTLKLRIVQEGKEVEDGQVGSIWAQSPRVAAGYYGQPKLTTSTFANILPGYDGSWLDTGDLGKVTDSQLYVTGRVKDVIIINGKNYYPTDVELSIDDLFGDIIRPGRTTAFQNGDTSVGITVEGRKGFDKSENEDLAVQIANHVSQFHGLFASEVVVLKLGVTPKTTSGKLKRSEIRQTTVDGDWKEASILLQFKRQVALTPIPIRKRQRPSFLEGSFSMLGIASNESYLNEETEHEIMVQSMSTVNWNFEELAGIGLNQTNDLPRKAVEAVHSVECIPSKLDEYFSELHLSGVSGIEEAWDKAIKTTAAMQVMCSQILKHLEDKHPTICQLAKTLSENLDWILIDDMTCFLSQLVHQIFVLQWVTTFMMDHPECIQQKLKDDAAWDAHGQNVQTVPVELQEMLNLPEQDAMYGKVPFFTWIKNRSVVELLNLVLQSLESAGSTSTAQVERINSLLCLNVLEAIWLEQKNGHKENSEAGRRLATMLTNAKAATTKSRKVLMEYSSNTSAVNDLYIDWNMHVVAWAGDRNSSSWMLSKLLLPCVIGDVNAHFFYARLISLHLVTQAMGRNLMSNKFQNEPILSRRALHYFGKLNLSSAEKLGHTPLATESKHQLALDEDYWLSKFDQWGLVSHTPPKASTPDSRLQYNAVSGAVGPDDFSTRYANTITAVFGYKVAASKSWAENGLTSFNSAELRNRVEEDLHVVLPPNFAQLYATPKELEEFLVSSQGQHFPCKAADEHVDFHWNNPRAQCSKLEMSIVQVLGFMAITLVLLTALFPSYLVAARLSNKCNTSEAQECLKTSFLWFPHIFPLFCFSFSIMVVLCKILVVGMYRPQEINLMSWQYLRWWFVDQLLHVWELFVGRFLLETKFAWLFYRLLGADIAWSTKINAFMRECDLVSVGANSSVGHAIRCRKFRPWTEGSPRMVFRPIIVGPNCNVSGMLSPGAVIGAGCKVERLTVVEEGAQVPPEVIARGNPAYNAGTFRHQESNWQEESLLDAFKVLWLFSEVYHYYALYFLAHAILQETLPTWRYASILHWFLLFPLASVFAMVTSILLKWLLIGKRDPSEEYERTLWMRATNWVCDYHFQIAAWMLANYAEVSRFDTLVQWCHGLDVDVVSDLYTANIIFSPSQVDFVKIRQSFLSLTEFDLDIPSPSGEKIEISYSSLGRDTIVYAGAKVIRSNLPSRSQVSDKIYDLNAPNTQLIVSWSFILLEVILPEVAVLIWIAILFWSFIPAYELTSAISGSITSPSVLVLVLVGAIAFHFFVWILLAKTFEWALLNVIPPSFYGCTFRVYASCIITCRWANPIDFLLMGTPLFQFYARIMGAEVNGDLWFFDHSPTEFGNCHFQGNTIVDSAYPRGHYRDINGLTLDDVYISGIVHPGCYIAAGALVEGRESGPWKSFFSSAVENVSSGKKNASRQGLQGDQMKRGSLQDWEDEFQCTHEFDV